MKTYNRDWIFGSFHLILAHLALFLYHMDIFMVGSEFLAMKLIRETTEIIVFFSSLFKLSMKFEL
jgi:hypothetical protein